MEKYLGVVILSITGAALITASIAGCDRTVATAGVLPAGMTLGAETDDGVLTTRLITALLSAPSVYK